MIATREKIEIPINKTRKVRKEKISATHNKRVISNLLVTVFAKRRQNTLLKTYKF